MKIFVLENFFIESPFSVNYRMEDAKRYRSDAECIIENYQLLRLEKLALSAREDEAREAYFQFRNNNKYLLAEFGEMQFRK